MRESYLRRGGALARFRAGSQRHGGDTPRKDPGPGSAIASDRLRDMQSITDAALSRLDPQDLLEELVARVRAVLDADTAAVLLLEGPAGHLTASAASGLEEEVLQGSRVPIGKGFAGLIAATAKPVVLDEVNRGNVVNPLLLAKGIKSLMGVLLLAGRTVIGVLHVGTLSPRGFTQHDMDLLQLAADRAALAVQELTARVDRAATWALQRSLLPSALPGIGGLEMAARYVPGSGSVGGDWYDVFGLPSGEICAVIGDVAGSGLNAAVIMGRARSALRAYALETADPAQILYRLDRKMRHFEPDALMTVQCAVIDPSLDEVLISSAGHLPPVIAYPDRPSALADISYDVMIGIGADTTRHVSSVQMTPGAVLCMYTDGLVERPDQSIDVGFARLREAVTACDPELGAASVMAAMADITRHNDDVALLMLRRSAGSDEQAGETASAPTG